MTRPNEIKPREGSVPGTPYGDFVEGIELKPVSFDITPAIVDEYIESVEADADLYMVDGRRAAPPNVIFPYMTVPLYCTYPPIQGIVMAEVDMQWHTPIWADETTKVVAAGKILKKFEKRGRYYVEWEGTFSRLDNTPIATLVNCFHVPE